MRKLITIMLCLMLQYTVVAQDTLSSPCWTPDIDTSEYYKLPWIGNNDLLEQFLDSINYDGGSGGAGQRIVGAPNVKYWIPIKFWIYRDDNGAGGPTLTQIQNLMDNLNQRFNQTNRTMIGFYLKCSPTYVNNSAHTVQTFTKATFMMDINKALGAINVHIIDRFHSAGTTGYALEPLNACMVSRESYQNPPSAGDLSHEVGHVLGLFHTHLYSHWDWSCLTEPVSRTRTWPTFNLCPRRVLSNNISEATGDGLKDTPADNDLLGNNACTYQITFGNDPWGDSYDNPPIA